MAGRGMARHGRANTRGRLTPPPKLSDFHGAARRGKARHGGAWQGQARRGSARQTHGGGVSRPRSFQISQGAARQGRGRAGPGLAWQTHYPGRKPRVEARSALDIQCPIPYNRITMNTTAIEQLKKSIQRAPDIIMGEWTSRDSSLCCPAALTCRAVGVHLRDAYHLASPILQITDTQADRLCYIDGWSDHDTTAWLTSKSPAQRKRLILKQIAAIERS